MFKVVVFLASTCGNLIGPTFRLAKKKEEAALADHFFTLLKKYYFRILHNQEDSLLSPAN